MTYGFSNQAEPTHRALVIHDVEKVAVQGRIEWPPPGDNVLNG